MNLVDGLLPQKLHVYHDSTGCYLQFSGDGVGALRHFYLVFVCEFACVSVCVGAARPGPVQLFCSVQLICIPSCTC